MQSPHEHDEAAERKLEEAERKRKEAAERKRKEAEKRKRKEAAKKRRKARIRRATASTAALVAGFALAAVVVVCLIAINYLPDHPPKVEAKNGPNVIAIAAAAFGVIGAIVGPFFGVTTAARALEREKKKNEKRDRRK